MGFDLRTILLAAAIAALSLPALAAESVTVEGQKSDDDVVTCVRSDPPLGSRMGAGKECHTKGEWKVRERISRQSVRSFDNMVSRGGVNNSSMGGGGH